MSTIAPARSPAASSSVAFRAGYSAELALGAMPVGWHALLREVFAELAALPVVQVEQVVRKFGTLTVHTAAINGRDLTDPAVDAQLDLARQCTGRAARRSGSTCERCGASGALRTQGAVTVLCADHADGRRALPTRA